MALTSRLLLRSGLFEMVLGPEKSNVINLSPAEAKVHSLSQFLASFLNRQKGYQRKRHENQFTTDFDCS